MHAKSRTSKGLLHDRMIDRQAVGDVGKDTWYYRQTLLPGKHTVVVLDERPRPVARFADYFVTAGLYPEPEVADSLMFDCTAGELYFFELRIELGWRYPEVREVDPAEGREAVNKGRLLLAPS